jgi:hypothetical protein
VQKWLYACLLALAAGLVPVLGCPDSPEAVSSVPVAADIAQRVAPECDRFIDVRLGSMPYRVALLHNRWHAAVICYEVVSAPDSYRLWIAFSREGVVLELVADPVTALPEGLAEACQGLKVQDVKLDAAKPEAAVTLVRAAAWFYAKALADHSLERAIQLALIAADTVTGAAP